jgi:hypothetical protein
MFINILRIFPIPRIFTKRFAGSGRRKISKLRKRKRGKGGDG